MAHSRFLGFAPSKNIPGRVRRTADPSASLRSGRDDKERATVEREWSPDRNVFHHLGWAAGPYNTRNDKKERVVVSVGRLPWDSAVVGAAGTPSFDNALRHHPSLWRKKVTGS